MIPSKIHSSDGFTLIEVLVSVVILSIGLLGIAGLQANSLRNNHGAFIKTQAANLAADMADRIRANPNATAADYQFDTEDGVPPKPNCINDDDGCNPTNLAQYDRFQWGQKFKRDTKKILPEGRGLITSAADVFTITISWREIGHDGLARANCAAIDDLGDDQACFTLSFRL